MKNWDLIILNPILFIIGLGFLIFLFINEKTSAKGYIYYLGVFSFWLAMGILENYLLNSLFNEIERSNKILIILLSLLGAYFVAILLKPIATFFTGKIKNRNIWIILGMFTAIISAIFIFVGIQVESLKVLWFILASLFFGFSLTVNTLHYLFLNEQFYYRINPIGSTVIISTIMLFSQFIAISLFNTREIVPNSNIFDITLFSCLALFIVLSIGTSFIKKESKSLVGSFDEIIKENLSKRDIPAIIWLCVISFLVALATNISNSMSVKMFISLNLLRENIETEKIILRFRLFDNLTMFPTIIIGYLMYKYVLRYLGFKNIIIINLFILAFSFTAEAFSHSSDLFIVANFFVVIAYTQIIFTFFSWAVMWNYRLKNIPLTGYVASSILLGKYCVSNIESIIFNSNKSIFGEYKNIEQVINDYKIGLLDIDNYYDSWNNYITIMLSISVMIIFFVLIIFFFYNKRILVEFIDYSSAKNNMKKIYKDYLINLTKLK